MNKKIFKKGIIFGFLSLLSVWFLKSAFANPLDVWHWRSPLPQGNKLNAVTYGNNIFVAVGDAGTIITSSDGKTWTVQNPGPIHHLSGIIYANNEFVAVGHNGTIITSSDGTTWDTQISSGTTNDLSGIIYANNEFVAVGTGGTVLTSSNGTTWIQQTSGISSDLYGITYDGGSINKLVAVGASGTIITSTDGTTWDTQINSGTSYDLYGITVDPVTSELVAVGITGQVVTSSNGTIWSSAQISSSPLYSVTFNYTASIFVAVGASGTIITSSDGTNWNTQISSGTQAFLYGDSYNSGGSALVAVGNGGTILYSSSSDNWANWVMQSYSATPNLDIFDITYADSMFVAAGDGGPITSTDGTTWDTQNLLTMGGGFYGGITYGDGKFVLPQQGTGKVFTSTDGTTWDTQVLGTNIAYPNGITYGNSLFVLVGSENNMGMVFTSPDGVTWTQQPITDTAILQGVAYGNGTFVAVGSNGTILTSSDGITWTVRTSNIAQTLLGVTYGNNEFVAVGDAGTILTSSNGTTWTKQISNTTSDLMAITYGNSTFAAVISGGMGNPGIILTSPDGINWTPRYPGTNNGLYAIAYGDNTFVAVGGNGMGTILQSNPFVSSSTTVSGTINYTGSDTGNIYIKLFTNANLSGNPAYDTEISTPVSYSITGINPGTYYAVAFMSTNGSTSYDSAIDPAGQYAGNPITLTSGQNLTGINITLLNPAGQVLSVSPSTGFSSSGNQGGPFSPSSTTYSVSNTGGGTLTWSVSADQSWVTVSPANGTNSGIVTISINSNANSLTASPTPYTSTVTFISNGGTITRQVSLTVNTPPVSTATVSGSISYTGSKTGNIYIGLFTNTNLSGSPVYDTEISTPGSYSISNINTGTYYVDAFMSTNGSTSYDSTIDPVGQYAGNPITLTQGQNATGTNINLVDPTIWYWRNPFPQGNSLYGIIYGNNEFVAVGANGTILISLDGGITWTQQTSGTSNNLVGITYGNNEFVAVGANGTILTSSDGKTWITQNSGTSNNLDGITYGNNEFVAAGWGYDSSVDEYYGIILTSSDGKTWAIQNLGTSSGQIMGITYGNNEFVAVGQGYDSSTDEYYGIILTSSDGKTWTQSDTQEGEWLTNITYGNNEFVVIGGSGSGEIFGTSSDGKTWTLQPSTISYNPLDGIIYGNNEFVVTGYDGTILTSTDGTTWDTQISGTSNEIRGITYGNNEFVAVGDSGMTLTSSDGKTWTVQSGAITNSSFSNITYGNNEFAAVGANGTILTSSDGTTWDTQISGTSNDLNGIVYGNNEFVAVGANGTILTSLDGITWTQQTSGTSNNIWRLTYGNNEFVAVGWDGTILTSSDGKTWAVQNLGTGNDFDGITYGNNEFVVIGTNGGGVIFVMTSSDGKTWGTQISLPSSVSSLNGIVYGNNEFVAVGQGYNQSTYQNYGTILTSTDGTTWDTQISETSNELYGITYENKEFVAVGGNGTILISSDGKTWITQNFGTNNSLNEIAYGNNTFVAVGANGTILQSNPFVPPATVLGTINYTGSDTGNIYVDLFTNANLSGNPAYDTEISTKGSYSITGINPGTYYAVAFMSTNGSTSYDSAIDPAGQYAGNPLILISGQNATGINITLLNPVGQVLSVSPSTGFSSSGNQGGPFSPSSTTYSVSNTGGGTLTWSVSADQSWVTVSPANGTNSGIVTVSINSNANSLTASPTPYTSTVTFISNGGTITRQVSLAVNTPPVSTATVSGSISYTGSKTGNIYIGLFTNSNLSGNPAYSTEISTPGSYSISNINPGTYYAAAFMSTNGSTSYDSAIDPAGQYTGNPITLTSGQNLTGTNITLINPPTLSVLSISGFSSIGLAGGPFSPSSTTYSVSNSGGGTLTWSVSANQNWVTVSPTNGTNSGTVTVSINSNANSLTTSPTPYTSTVTFTSNGGTTTRQVSLTVSTPPVFNNIKIYDINGNQLTGIGDVPVDYLVQFTGTYTAGSDGANEETTIWTINDTTGIDTEIYTTNSGTSSYIWIPRNILSAGATYSITAQTEDSNDLWSTPSTINFTTVPQPNTIDTTINPNTGAQGPSDQVPTDTNIKQYFSDGILPDTAAMINFNNTPVLVETSTGDTIIYLGQFTPDTPPPAGAAFDGVFTTKIKCTPGATITVTYIFPQNLPAGTKWYKYIETNPVGQQWVEYPNAVIIGNTVIVQLTDGGQGDQDGTENGIILDPSGPIQQPIIPISSGGSGGVPVEPIAVVIVGLLLLIKTIQRKKTKSLSIPGGKK